MCNDKFNTKQNKKIVDWCGYCRNPIYEGEDYRCKDGIYYHDDKDFSCYNQMNTYLDPDFIDDEE